MPTGDPAFHFVAGLFAGVLVFSMLFVLVSTAGGTALDNNFQIVWMEPK